MTQNLSIPYNVEAERAVLGSLVIDPDAIVRVSRLLRPEAFYIERYGLIYKAILGLFDRRLPIDLVTLADELKQAGDLANVGGDAALTDLITAVPTSVHVEHYAGLVHRDYVRRCAIDGVQKLAQKFYGGNDVDQALAQWRAIGANLEQLVAHSSDGISLRESLDAYLDLLDARDRDKDRPKLQFPWPDLADLMPYLMPGTMIAIAAESGVGKTAFLENCAEAWAKEGWRVAFFHYELAESVMFDRRMQRATGIPVKRLQSGGRLEVDDYERIIEETDKIAKWSGSIQYLHCPGWGMGQVLSTAQKLHDMGRVDVVILDYLNKMPLIERVRGMNVAQVRGADIEDFKTGLEQNGWVGLLAAQFDKVAKHRRRLRTLADVRDTGELDDKANVGLVIDRPREEEKKGRRSNNTKLHVVKCTLGREDEVDLYFQSTRLKFQSVAKQDSGND